MIKKKWIIFIDFDETYSTNYKKTDHKFIKKLKRKLRKKNFIYGLVSGANIKEILKKIKKFSLPIPCFIASSLGTELYFYKKKKFVINNKFQDLILKSSNRYINKNYLLNEIKKIKIKTLLQPEIHQTNLKSSFYCNIKSSVIQKKIFQIANNNNLRVCISKCVKGANDPKNKYDVDFIPKKAGKDNVVNFLKKKYPKLKNSISFGDSMGDENLFLKTNKSYLVGNASLNVINFFKKKIKK